jgi:acetylornithine deacetylase/succinyl-diaminopimelate desuccinylase-like protein
MDSLAAAVAAQMDRARAELSELVAFPSVFDPAAGSTPVGDAAGDWVAAAFRDAGIADARTVRTSDGSLAVVGHQPGPAGTPTVLLYSHYDVQPPLGDDEWRSPVWTLTERDGRWYGRGTADCKGNVIMHLAALRALRADDGGLPCGVKVVCEGSEELGGSGLAELVPQQPELLDADAVLVADSGNPRVGEPALTISLRGMAVVDVRLEALGGAVHSGSFGGAAPDPLAGLIAMLATLRDEHGDTTVDGIRSDQRWNGAPLDADRFRADALVLDGVDLIGSGSVSDQVWARPSLTVTGIDVPSVAGAVNAVQPSAAARITLRLPPAMDPLAAQQALMDHLRARVPWNLRATITPVETGAGFAAATDGPAFAALREALGGAVELLGEGGAIPLCAVLHTVYPDAEILLFGIEEPLSRIHAPNESVDPREIERTALAEARFLRAYAVTPRRSPGPH